MKLDASTFAALHTEAQDWNTYLARDPKRAEGWRAAFDAASLSPEQQQLVSGFVRTMHILCLTGIWCGDCVQQLPLLQRIADASSCIDLRYLERDDFPELQEALRINAGDRVPVVLFLAEDFEPVSVAGDRTLSRYRALAARTLGPACPLPGAPLSEAEWKETLSDWLEECERVHLLLRLSGRLRQRHAD